MKKVIYPGTFDPITFGHLDLIKRALKVFDGIVIAVAVSPEKRLLFSLKQRMDMVKKTTKGWGGNIEVHSFKGLVVEYARSQGINTVMRGLRMISDFEYEFQMALTNRKLNEGIETIFMMPHEEYSYLSSKLIKEVASLGGDVSKFVPTFVEKELKTSLKKRG